MNVHCERRGEGSPLLLVHGIGHRWQAWEPVMDLLAAHHHVIAVDLPGFGASPVPAGGMPKNMAATVAALGEFLAGLGIQRAHVAGNSLGGAIALELAASGLVASATAFSPAGFFTDAERRRALRILSIMRATTFQPEPLLRRTLSRPAIRSRSFGQLVAHPDRLDLERAIGDALAFRRGAGFRAVARTAREYSCLATPTVPVTVAWGTRDRILPPNQAERARQRLPNARHVPMPDCGHVPMSDDPELTARLILQTTGALLTDGT